VIGFNYNKCHVIDFRIVVGMLEMNCMINVCVCDWGFNIREIIDSSLLNSPLLSWDGILNKKISCQNVINIISPFFLKI